VYFSSLKTVHRHFDDKSGDDVINYCFCPDSCLGWSLTTPHRITSRFVVLSWCRVKGCLYHSERHCPFSRIVDEIVISDIRHHYHDNHFYGPIPRFIFFISGCNAHDIKQQNCLICMRSCDAVRLASRWQLFVPWAMRHSFDTRS
jgi:hypothetical protein